MLNTLVGHVCKVEGNGRTVEGEENGRLDVLWLVYAY